MSLKTLRNYFTFERNRFDILLHGSAVLLRLAVGRIVPLLQLAGAENGECQCTGEVRGRQGPKDDGPLLVGLILVRDGADHEAAKKTAYRAEGIGNAEYGSGKIGRDVETISQITRCHGAVYRQTDGEYCNRRRAIATVIYLNHHEDARS